MFARRLGVAVALWMGAADTAFADIISRCGPSSGYAHYPQSELVSKAQAGWRQDGISNGALQLMRRMPYLRPPSRGQPRHPVSERTLKLLLMR